MDIGTILALVGFVLMIGFIVFAFRQGLKVKPGKGSDDYTGGSDGGSGGGAAGGHGGGH